MVEKTAGIAEEPLHKQKRAFIFLGPRGSGKSSHTTYLEETIRGELIQGRNILPREVGKLAQSRSLIPDEDYLPSLKDRLRMIRRRKVIFDNIPRTLNQAELLLKWSRMTGYQSHIVELSLSEGEVIDRAETRLACFNSSHRAEAYHPVIKPPKVESVCDICHQPLVRRVGDNGELAKKAFGEYQMVKGKIIDLFQQEGAFIHRVNASGTIEEASRRIFLEIDGYIFQEAGMAADYYQLRDLCHPPEGEHIFVAGVSTYIHDPSLDDFKDFDILVPDDKIGFIAGQCGKEIGEKVSPHAYTKSIYPGRVCVEALSNLIVYTDGQKISFPFEFLWEEVKHVRFMGLRCPFMGIEDLMLFYAALGREGLDYQGKMKYDLTNLARLSRLPAVDWLKLRERAEKLGMIKRLRQKLAEKNLPLPW